MMTPAKMIAAATTDDAIRMAPPALSHHRSLLLSIAAMSNPRSPARTMTP
ncbi:hypothetical protein ACE10Z_09780 [Bradyrhizobium sp. Pha-3]